MKTTYLYFICLFISLVACQQETSKKETEIVNTPIVDSIADPNVFIGKHKAKAMVLGVFHFNNPGLDSYKPQFPFNILEEKRQAELETLLSELAAYQPTKILIEWDRTKSDSITNVKYQQYLAGEFSIDEKHNEVYQIGFKLAKKLGHAKIYCSDSRPDWFGEEIDWDNYDGDAYMKAHGQYKKASRYNYEPFYKAGDSLKTTRSLSKHFAAINDPTNRLKDHQAYFTAISEGANDHYLGADATANWYRRNLRIFANAHDFTNFDQEERLLLIYGSGHVWQLRQFFTDSPDYNYVEASQYLK